LIQQDSENISTRVQPTVQSGEVFSLAKMIGPPPQHFLAIMGSALFLDNDKIYIFIVKEIEGMIRIGQTNAYPASAGAPKISRWLSEKLGGPN